MLKRSKQTLLSLLKNLSVFERVQMSAWRQKRLLILGYHGVSIDDEHKWDPCLFMPPDYFRERLQLLRDLDFEVLPLGEAVRRLYEDTLPNRCVALTFDDGFYNFHKIVAPMLKEFNYPATLYLTTYYVNYNRPVFDSAVSYILWKRRNQVLNLEEVTDERLSFKLSDPAELTQAHHRVISYARRMNLSAAEKDRLAAKLAKCLNFDYEELVEKRLFTLMAREQVRQIAEEGFDVQLHTHRHCLPVNPDLFNREILENRSFIEELTKTSTPHFCYPSGIFDDSFTPWLNNLGVTTATTCEPGLATQASHPLYLPRLIDTTPISLIEFEGWLTGVSSLLPRRQKVYNPGAGAYTQRMDVSVHG